MQSKRIVRSVALLIAWASFGPSLFAADTPLNIGTRKQLFIDQRFQWPEPRRPAIWNRFADCCQRIQKKTAAR
jgi:hypothetical protein